MEFDRTAIGLAGSMHLLVFGIIIPVLAIRTSRRLTGGPLPPKKQYFVSVIVQLAAFGAFSYAVARKEWIELFPRKLPPYPAVLAGAAALVVMILLARPKWRKRVEARSRKAWLFMPRDATDRALWVGCSTAAGLSEEMTFRGVLFVLLWRLTGYAIAAALIGALVFAIAHYLQGWKSMALIFGIALLFQGLAWISGSLYVSIAVHALYDIAAGFHYGRYGRELGYPVDAPPPEAGPAPAPAV